MVSWLRRFQRRRHEQAFLESLRETESFKKLIRQQPCPACGVKGQTLLLAKFVRNPAGWDAEVTCSNCNFTGVVNSLGFELKQLNSKGKARE